MTKINHTYLIDDNEFVLMIGEKSITNHPAYNRVSTFENAKLAFDALNNCIQQNKPLPDLIILDVNMPEMNGWEFMAAFSQRQDLVHIPVFLFTTPVDEEVMEKASKYALVRGFLSKSLPYEEIDNIAKILAAGQA